MSVRPFRVGIALLCTAVLSVPALAQEPAQPRIEGSTMIFDGGERLDLEKQEIILQGTICLQQGPIELFACAPGGKDHESIVVLQCNPQNLHLALLALGLRDRTELGGGGPKFPGDPERPVGDRVLVEIEFERDGKTQRHRAEDLVLNMAEKKPMERAGWVFVGSAFDDEKDPETGKPTGRKLYLANRYRSLMTTYHDPTTLIDNPTIDGGDDDLFWANPERLSAPGTPCKVILRAPSPEEAAEMEKAEAAVAARAQETPKDGSGETPGEAEKR